MDEQQAAVIPESIHPAGKKHLAADIIMSQLPAKDTLGKKHEKSPFYSNYGKTTLYVQLQICAAKLITPGLMVQGFKAEKKMKKARFLPEGSIGVNI